MGQQHHRPQHNAHLPEREPKPVAKPSTCCLIVIGEWMIATLDDCDDMTNRKDRLAFKLNIDFARCEFRNSKFFNIGSPRADRSAASTACDEPGALMHGANR